MGIRVLRRNLHRLHRLGWTWKQVGDICGRSRGWVCSTAKGRYKPPGYVIREISERVKEAMRELPRELWQTTKELREQVFLEIKTNHVGIESAIKSRYLAQHLGTTDRMIRACVNELREAGEPICSSVGKPAGFYWPRTMREYKEFRYRDYASRIKKMQKALDAMDMAAEAIFEGKPLAVIAQAEMALR